jgi:hypothetical protein
VDARVTTFREHDGPVAGRSSLPESSSLSARLVHSHDFMWEATTQGLIVWGVFTLATAVFCFWKPQPARVFVGLFFAAMGLGIHGMFVLTNPIRPNELRTGHRAVCASSHHPLWSCSS